MDTKQKHKMTLMAISGLLMFPAGEKRGYMAIYLGLRAYVEAGHTVYFLTCRPPLEYYENQDAQRPPDRTEDGIHVHEFYVPLIGWLSRFRRIKLPENPVLHYLAYFIQILLCEYLILALFTLFGTMAGLRMARRLRPDVVYGFHIGNVAAWIIGRLQRIPIITRVFGTFLHPLLGTRFYKFRYFTSVLAFTVPCDSLIVLDDGTRGDKVAEVLGVPPGRLKFWRDGIHPDMLAKPKELVDLRTRWNIPEEHKVVMTLGRLWIVKGFHKLIRAVPHIVAQEKNVTFLIVGEGGERAYLENLARDLGVSHWVKFPGSVAHDEVKSSMYASDIFVQLCDISNLTNVLLEALTCHRCVVTLDDGTTRDLIENGESGFLAPPNDDRALADIIVRLLRDDALRLRVGHNAGRRAAERLLTWPQRNQMEIDLVEDLVFNGRR